MATITRKEKEKKTGLTPATRVPQSSSLESLRAGLPRGKFLMGQLHEKRVTKTSHSAGYNEQWRPSHRRRRHNLQSLNAAPKIYPLLHDDYANDGSVPYVQTFCRSVCILLLQDYRNSSTSQIHTQDFNTLYQELSSGTGVQDSPRLNPSAMVIWEVTAAPMISRYSSAYFIVDAN